MTEPIKFDCEIRQVKTMADHTANLTLNIPEYNMKEVAALLECIGDLAMAAVVVVQEVDEN